MDLAVQQVVGLWVFGRQRKEGWRGAIGGVRSNLTSVLCSDAAITDALEDLKITHIHVSHKRELILSLQAQANVTPDGTADIRCYWKTKLVSAALL